MSDSKTYQCKSCGADLPVLANMPRIFCQYCGAANMIEDEKMRIDLDSSGSYNIKATTEIENIKRMIRFAIETKEFKKAKDSLMQIVLLGAQDYEIYILKTMIDMQESIDDCEVIKDLERLSEMEKSNSTPGMLADLRALMQHRGDNGLQPLHFSAFYERLDLVQYCVAHGGDVNSVAADVLTPIECMFIKADLSQLKNPDGTPFQRNKQSVREIRRFLMERGAKDKFRPGY